MKKILLLLIGMICQVAALQAFDIEARVAYFYPQDHRLREIYGKNGWADYEIEVSAPLNFCCDCSYNWDLWFNTSYYTKRGHSTCLHHKTRVQNWAFNFGIKRYFDSCMCFRPYLGLGGGFAHIEFNDKSPFVKRHIDRWGGAFLAKSGIRYDITCNFFVDLFVDYGINWYDSKHSRRCVKTRSIDAGGLKAGLGLGFQF